MRPTTPTFISRGNTSHNPSGPAFLNRPHRTLTSPRLLSEVNYRSFLALEKRMSSNGKPATVLVHGAWHVPKHYTDFIARLQHAGFEVFCPLLPTCDESKRPNGDLYADAQVVRNLFISLIEQSRDVVVILHSYGGAVGAEAIKGLLMRERAAEGLQGGVTHLIYMCGFMLQVGESVGGASLPRPDPDPVVFDDTTKTTFLCESSVQLF
ncbi:MAG: hypothetical protein Q9207_006817 [Kuettlingeria erythrocarpa]